MTIEDMAKAHVESVKKAIDDLVIRRDNVNKEIENLLNYVKKAESVIADHQHVNSEQPSIRGL
jgi:hypothetical protein